MKHKCIVIIFIILLIASITIADAKHYSTDNPHQNKISKPHHHKLFEGHPPPNRHPISDNELSGVGQHWNEDHKDDY